MVGTTLWWAIQPILSLLDFVMVYIITHAAIRRRIEVRPVHILFAVVYALTLTPVFYFGGLHVYRLISYVCAILIIKIVTKRRNIVDLFIVFAICTALMIVLGLPAVALGLLANTQLMLVYPLDFLVIQSIIVVLVILACKKLKLNQWFTAVKRNIVLKLVLLIIFLVFVVASSILSYEYDVMFFLVSTGAVIAIGLPLWPVLMNIYKNSLGMIAVHDLKNSLIALEIAMQDMTDIGVLKEEVRHIAKSVGVDMSYLDNAEAEYEKELENEIILTRRVKDFIEAKVKSKGKDVVLVLEVAYFQDYETVNFTLLLQWLGALLDNAIEATDSKPIYLFVEVGDYFMDIRISNEYAGDKDQDIKGILEKGYSTKGEGRGIGLHNLNRQVIEKGGKVKLDNYYEESHKCYYLQIGIFFEKH